MERKSRSRSPGPGSAMAWTAWPEQGPVRVQGFGPEQLESWSCRPRASRGSQQADPGLDVAPRKSCPGVSLWWRSLGEEAGPRPRAVLAPGGRLPCRSGEPRGGNPPLGEQSREGKGEPACRSPDVLGARTARPPTRPAEPGVPLSCRVCGIVTTWALVAFLLGRPSP